MNEARADDGDWSAAEFEKAKWIALTCCLDYDCGDGNNLTKSEHYEGLAAAWGAVLVAPTGSQLLRASQLAASRQLLTGTSLLDDTLNLADGALRLADDAPRLAAPNTVGVLDDAATAERHLARLDHSPANDAMLDRIGSAAADGRPLHASETNFFQHEVTEAGLMDGGMRYPEAHGIAGQTHPTFANYHPEVIDQFPDRYQD